MKTLSPLASQILPFLSVPASMETVHKCFADDTTIEEVEAALDELVPHHATCDEAAGIPYFYRRDTAAEKIRAAKWNDAARAAERTRLAAIAAAERAYIVAMDAADAERDAADPMAAIKARALNDAPEEAA